jgi:hypothetical protein
MSELEPIPVGEALAAAVQAELDATIDAVLDTLERAAVAGVDVNPLETIVRRVQARGAELNFDELPPLAKMVIGGMLEP